MHAYVVDPNISLHTDPTHANPYIVNEPTEFLEFLNFWKSKPATLDSSDPKKFLKMKVEKLAELKIELKIWSMRVVDTSSKLIGLSKRSPNKGYYNNAYKISKKKEKEFELKVDRLKQEVDKLIEKQQLVHNNVDGDKEIYTFENKEQLASEREKLKNELNQLINDKEQQKAELERQSKLLHNDREEIEKIKEIVERTEAKIRVLQPLLKDKKNLIRRRIVWYY